MMNGMGEVIVSWKVREEKGKCKEKPAGLEEGENMQEELGMRSPWKDEWCWVRGFHSTLGGILSSMTCTHIQRLLLPWKYKPTCPEQ